jgi:hypothetical protein
VSHVTPRTALLALLVGLLVGLVAGCGGSSGRSTATATAPVTSSNNPAPVGFAGKGHTFPAPVTSATPAAPASASPAAPASSAPLPQAGPGGLSGPATRAFPAPARPITVGPGPVVGRTVRGDVQEQLREWTRGDVRALDPLDARLANDGLRDARELVALSTRRDAGRLCVRVDLLDLRYGAELGGLDLVLLLGWGSGRGATALPLGLRETTAHPWDAALVVQDTVAWSLLDASLTPVPGATLEQSWRSDLDAIELALPEAALRGLGWAGQELTLQLVTTKDGEARADDALLEVDLNDRRLDEATRESWVADRAAVLAPVVVGNRAALPAHAIRDLVWSTRTTTSEGFPTGLRRTVEAHTAHGLPVTIHLTGALGAAIGWAASPLPEQDGPTLLRRMSELWDGDPTNGQGAFLVGTWADAILPYVEGEAARRMHALSVDFARERLGVTAPGPVFWSAERVVRGSTLDLVKALGHTHTVIDRTHLEGWFSARVTDGRLHRVNGVDCFVLDPSVNLFGQQDGGPELALRRLLLARALDPDAQQAVVLAYDWEEFAGQKGNPDVPDLYERSLQWLAQRPWVEVVTLDDLARRGWRATDHGGTSALPVETHDWLRHACEGSYDNWFYGHPLEESFAAMRPVVRHGRPFTRAMGDLVTPGTLLGDGWARIAAAPAGGLKDVATRAFAHALYRTAWHAEDMNDLTRLATGAYAAPDTSFDRFTGFVVALSTHVGDAAVVARAAQWAASPPAAPVVLREDADLDGELELLLCDDRLLLVLEPDGGRVVAGFARDAAGHGVQVLGAPHSYPEASPEAGWEDPTATAPRTSTLKDVWLSAASPGGGGRDYVNDAMVATVSTTSVGVTFRSSDGVLEKSLRWAAPGRVEVTYRLAPGSGTLSVRAGLCPDLATLLVQGAGALRESDTGRVLRLEARTQLASGATRVVGVELDYAGPGHSARRNAAASDGQATSPRTVAFQQLVELQGDAPGFGFSLAVDVR